MKGAGIREQGRGPGRGRGRGSGSIEALREVPEGQGVDSKRKEEIQGGGCSGTGGGGWRGGDGGE